MEVDVGEGLILEALRGLDEAQRAMRKETWPSTPLPRPRVFLVANGPGYKVVWPKHGDGGPVDWGELGVLGSSLSFPLGDGRTATWLVKTACEEKPRAILRALRRIEAATAWCQERLEGRRRMAEEILRQQRGALEALRERLKGGKDAAHEGHERGGL